LWNSRRYDEQTDYYYKYHHYKAEIGRWLGRDPIGEWGGFNLYRVVNNSRLSYWDVYGLSTIGDIEKLLRDPGAFASDKITDKIKEAGGKLGGAAVTSAQIGKAVADAVAEEYKFQNILKDLDLTLKEICALHRCVKFEFRNASGLDDAYTNLPAINICLIKLGHTSRNGYATGKVIKGLIKGLKNGFTNGIVGASTDK